MNTPDESLNLLESKIPAITGAAFEEAFLQALKSGQRVLVSADDGIYEVAADGTHSWFKDALAPTPVVKGTRVRIP